MSKAMTWMSLLAAGLLESGAVQATLIDRGGGLIYDDVLDVTWLQDANYAATSGYAATNAVDSGSLANGNIFADGRMGWAAAIAWADGLSYFDSVRGVTWSDWRLPFVVDTDGPDADITGDDGCDPAFSGTDCRYNVQTYDSGTDTVYSELAYMWHENLGNIPFCDTSGICIQAGWGLSNTGPFTNLQSDGYWSGTAYAPAPASHAWVFGTSLGYQNFLVQIEEWHAWAVRPGDVAAVLAVPEPGSLALAGLALGGLAWRRRGRLAGAPQPAETAGIA